MLTPGGISSGRWCGGRGSLARTRRRENFIDPIAPVHIQIIGNLVDCDGILFEIPVRIGYGRHWFHLNALWIAGIKLGSLHQLENDQTVPGEHADIAVVVEQSASSSGRGLEQVLAEEGALVRPAYHPEQ